MGHDVGSQSQNGRSLASLGGLEGHFRPRPLAGRFVSIPGCLAFLGLTEYPHLIFLLDYIILGIQVGFFQPIQALFIGRRQRWR
eukprot:9787709-Ditylum_brightwellii.AAC.1